MFSDSFPKKEDLIVSVCGKFGRWFGLERIDSISDKVYNDILSYYKLPEMPSSLSSYPQLIIDSEKLPVLGGYEKGGYKHLLVWELGGEFLYIVDDNKAYWAGVLYRKAREVQLLANVERYSVIGILN